MIDPKVLFIDDDPDILAQLEISLKGYKNLEFEQNWQDGIERITNDPHNYCLVFIDHQHPNAQMKLEPRGPFIANKIKNINSDIKIVILSGDKSRSAVKSWLDIGVDYFIYKPVKTDVIIPFIDNAMDDYKASFVSQLPGKNNFTKTPCNLSEKMGFICESQKMKDIARKALRFAVQPYPVFICGETGTGKGEMAKAINDNSVNAGKEMFTINCTRYGDNQNMMISELFGHAKGSFTGAMADKIGVFEKAKGRTIFIDEVHHLPLKAQAMLLLTIENKTVQRLGDSKQREVDFKLIVAGQPVIDEMLANNEFYEDLYQRFAALRLDLPRLQERKDEIEFIAISLQNKIESEIGLRKTLTPQVIRAFKGYRWPSNIRGLLNELKRLTVEVESKVVGYDDLHEDIKFKKSSGNDNQYKLAELQKVIKYQSESLEKQLLITALRETNCNVMRSAKLVNMDRSTFRRKLKKYDLTDFAMIKDDDSSFYLLENFKQKLGGIR